MSNILNAISDGLNADGVDRVAQLTGGLGEQVQNLSSLGSLFSNLMSDPSALTDLVRNLDEMDLPDFGLDSGFGDLLGNLQSLLPDDIGNVLGPMLEGLDHLEGSVLGDLSDVITQSVEAVQAIQRLTQMRLLPERTDASDTSSGGEGESEAEASSSPSPAEDSPAGGAEAGSGGEETPAPVEAGEEDDAPEPEGTEASAQEATATAATLETIDRLLDILPDEASVHNVMEVVAKAASKRSQLPFKIPLLDELGDIVQTLLNWEQMDSAAVHAQLDTTLQQLTQMLQRVIQDAFAPVETDLGSIRTALRLEDLQTIAVTLQTQFTALAAAIAANDLSATAPAVAALNEAGDQLAAVSADWATGFNRQLAGWHQDMAQLPEDLEDRMGHRMQLLRPVDPLGHLLENRLPTGWAENPTAMQAFADQLDRYVAWLWDLVNRIDLQAIEAPLTAIADGAQTALDGLDGAMVAVTMQVQSLFSEAESTMDQLDIEGVTQTITDAIDQFGNTLTTQLQDLTAPIRDAVETLISELQGSLSGFNPTAIQEACEQVMAAIQGILGSESLKNIAGSIATAIDTAAARIDELSFAPVADLVIAAIDEVTEALQSIDTSELDTMLQMALDAAVELLPQDIAALTDPLIDELGRLIEEEAPLPQLTQVLDKPQQMLAFVRQYEPQTLIGDALSAPFEALLGQLRAFQPSQMLRDPVNQVLDTLKSRLADNANPAMLLDPLIPLFDELVGKIDALQPTALIEPIEARMQALIDNLLQALHIDDIMAQFDGLIAKIEEIFNLGDRAREILQRMSTMAQGLFDAQSQFSTWLDPIFEKLSLPDGDGPLSASQSSLAAAVDALGAEPLRQRFSDAVAPVTAALTAANAGQLLVPAVQAYRTVSREQLAHIPGFEAEKAAITLILDRCNPMQAAFAAPFQAVADFAQRIEQTRLAIETRLDTWNAQWLAPDSALAELRDMTVAGDGLRNQMMQTVERQIVQPFAALLDMAKPLTDGVAPLITALERVIQLLQTKIENAVLGEDGLGGIRTALNGLVDRIDNFDLSFLTDSIQELFDGVKDKLQALSPQTIRDAVDAEFKQLLDAISLDLILPPQDPDPLDTLFDELVGGFEVLHPDTTVVAPLQQIFDDNLLPLLDVFDLTPVIQELLDKLAALDEGLKTEMQRVNGAYNAMLQAVP